jgi:hypothetical protein
MQKTLITLIILIPLPSFAQDGQLCCHQNMLAILATLIILPCKQSRKGWNNDSQERELETASRGAKSKQQVMNEIHSLYMSV